MLYCSGSVSWNSSIIATGYSVRIRSPNSPCSSLSSAALS
ncbi:Uncharacterised protein [Vibrio cholerae]|nr:Uncharacterised protein [Vibrio cholerae]CSI46957.1 Uncharacterised protein [Vibrio cholerae]CSI57079.1 Uncharacterised protein [Vibrio cholerae]